MTLLPSPIVTAPIAVMTAYAWLLMTVLQGMQKVDKVMEALKARLFCPEVVGE
ncbi:hypothetical protein [Limnoglobus roseus]|uniref:hypothetical protein n=1 Tax=Limnoglobus roseus TaxID=2598579 RepID=UPI00143D8B27|nr:hypothetical protein [Limnoglobus roseus]